MHSADPYLVFSIFVPKKTRGKLVRKTVKVYHPRLQMSIREITCTAPTSFKTLPFLPEKV